MSADITRILNKLDSLFARREYAEAEGERSGDDKVYYLAVNEQMGLYRKLNRREDAMAAVDRMLRYLDCKNRRMSVEGATALLNAGTVYKAFGQSEEALPFFEEACFVYEELLPSGDRRLAGLYNNMSSALSDLARYDIVQGSRFIKGGKAINTPFVRNIAVRLIHAPVISLTAHHKFTDTTNAYRGYSRRYLEDKRVQPLRDIFKTYELLAYLSVRATQIGMNACEVPVTRAYPKKGKTPTKISFFKGNSELMKILMENAFGAYNPR